MFRKILALFFLIILVLPASVSAQENASLSQVDVALWPEFDRPTTLVIYRLTLSPQASLPVPVRLRIPAAAGSPNAVAAKQPDGSLLNIPYEISESGDWSTIEFQATTPEVQVEYYDPGLEKNGSARHFEYTWPGDYAVGAFKVEVQQPAGASDLRIKPGMASSAPGSDGLTYHTLDVGSLAADQPFDITVDYQKADDQLTSDNVPVEPSGPLDEAASTRLSMTSALPWALGLLGLALIIGGGVWYWQSGRNKSQPRGEHHPRRPASERTESVETAQEGHVYCHKCGKRAAPSDRFCRTCGAQLRLGG